MDDQLTIYQQNNVRTAVQIAQNYSFDHSHQVRVSNFSLILFDGLQNLHHFGQLERFWLLMASILHDIGSVEGQEDHHKTSLNIILNNSSLDLNNKERLIIGSIARYHRKSLPCLDHDHFAVLEKPEQILVLKLASLLRLADGLDHIGEQKIRYLGVNHKKRKVLITCKIIADAAGHIRDVNRSDLFELVFKIPVEIKWCKLL